jgi:uncharacterized protein
LPDTAATPHPPGETPATSRIVRYLMLALAVVSLGLGALGLFLPLLPTVPFLLLATWAAARSSPRLQQALLNHPRIGPPVREWQNGGVIRRRAKVMATLTMAGSALMMLVLVDKWWVCAVAIGFMAGMLIWIWCRPEHPPAQAAKL